MTSGGGIVTAIPVLPAGATTLIVPTVLITSGAITGKAVTVTVVVPVAVWIGLPLSVTVIVTVVTPTGNTEPEAGVMRVV